MSAKFNWSEVPKYFAKPVYVVQWVLLEKVSEAPRHREYWTIHLGKQHIGEIFQGVGDRWYGFIFGGPTLTSSNVEHLCLHLIRRFYNPWSQ